MELVRAQRQDEAIALLLPAFRRKVFGLAYSFLRNREAAEDVTQDVFIKVWRALWAKMDAMGGYCGDRTDPALSFANCAPRPRQATWAMLG